MKFLWMTILSLPIIAGIGCGGAGSANGGPTPTPVPTPTPPTSGEYLFEGNSSASLNLASIHSSTGALGSPTLLASQADDDVIYPGVAVTPSKKFLYALFTSFTVVQGFQISGPGLQLTKLSASPFSSPASGPMNSMVLHPSGQFLYVIQSLGKIQEFSTNTTTGDLTAGSTLTSAADFRVAVIEPAGKFLYVTDLTGGRVVAYQINSADGSLAAVTGSPFIISATAQPDIPVIERTGHFLYVSLISGVAAFAINSSTGALSAVPGSPFPTSNTPVFIAADPVGNFIYVCNNTNGLIDGFAVDTTSGVLSVVPGSPVSTAQGPSNITVDPSGNFVYVSIEPSNTVYGFSLNSSGSLSPLAGSPFIGVPNPTNLFIASF